MMKPPPRRIVPFAVALALISVAGSQPSPLVEPNLALSRGCRDGGPGNINRVKPQWVSVQPGDAPQVAEGLVTFSKVTHEDNPANHTSHDWNFDVQLDPASQFLHSTANPIENGGRQMEMEWETRFFPAQFWPIAGDRVWMMGRWIFDCGHPPYRTELHPVKAVAFTRLEPTLFAGQSMPALTNRVFVYLNGQGGYYRAPVATRNYEFDVPLPAKPFTDTPLRFNRLRAEVLSLPFGGPTPILTPQPAVNPTRVHVVYPLALGNPNPNVRYGAILAVGWQESGVTIQPTAGKTRFRQLRITFDSLKINTDHDPFFSGEWRLWVRAGSTWFEVSGLGDVDDGDTIQIGRAVTLIVPEGGSWSVQTTGWEDDCDDLFRSTEAAAEQNTTSAADLRCLVDGNDKIGTLEQGYDARVNFGIGNHDALSRRTEGADADTKGDFSLRFRVEELARFPKSQILPPVVQ